MEIPADEVARETDTLIQKYQKLARIPGFRTGHAPASIIKQRFAEGIKSDVVDALVPRYFRKEAEKLGLTPVSQPQVTDLHVHDGEPMRFKASFEVMPTIRVEDYKELRADKPDISVTDEEVEQSLKRLQEERATFTTIEGSPLGDGDFAQVSLDGKPKDAEGATPSPVKPGPTGSNPVHMDDILVEIGGKGTMPEFTENLRGASAGDARTFDVHYPAGLLRPAPGRQDLYLCSAGEGRQAKDSAGIERSVRERFRRVCRPCGCAKANPRRHGSREKT